MRLITHIQIVTPEGRKEGRQGGLTTNYWTTELSSNKYVSCAVWCGKVICEFIEKNEKGSFCHLFLNILAFYEGNEKT